MSTSTDLFLAFLFLMTVAACGGGTSTSTPDAERAEETPPAEGATNEPGGGYESGNGTCEYDSLDGTITIVSIESPGPHIAACKNDGRSVRFTFAPDDPAAPSLPPSLQAFERGYLTIGDGKGPPSACLTPLGVVVGAKFRATRRVETKGTCAPVLYAPAIDLTSCTAQCEM